MSTTDATVAEGCVPARYRESMPPGCSHLAALAALALTGASVAGCGAGDTATVASVPTAAPAPAATPQQVVRSFLTAAIARDLPTVRRLTTPAHFAMLRRAPDGELTNWLAVDDLRVGSPRRNPELVSSRRYPDVWYVPVTFTLRQREVITFNGGPTTWGYVVARRGPSQPWRITEEGVG